ncbi:MAG: CPBP family intramembrane glutamic endopeptidase [Candidatus Acidiferrum sp.]
MVRWSARRVSCLVEALGFVGYVGWYIWRGQAMMPATWWVFAVWLAASFLLRRDTPKTMGWRGDNLWAATRKAWVFFAGASAAVCGAGLFLGMLHRLPTHFSEPRKFVGYFAFCMLQQVGLNSFLTNRLVGALEKPVPAALAAGVLFAALHWPNPVLVPLTFVGGAAMAWLFARERNILPLALGQAILGALVWWAFPMAWHHSMRVGPGYLTFGK